MYGYFPFDVKRFGADTVSLAGMAFYGELEQLAASNCRRTSSVRIRIATAPHYGGLVCKMARQKTELPRSNDANE